MDFSSVSARVQELRGFGPWIAFKVADMIDRLGMGAVDFDEAGVFMFKDPAKAALILRGKQDGKDYIHHGTKEQQGRAIHEVVTYLVGVFDGLSAPPLYDRPIGLQEVETVLCKWKSHLNGHYPLGKDTCEINEGLVDWLPHSDNAGKFYLNMVKERDDGGKERKQQSAPAAGAATAG